MSEYPKAKLAYLTQPEPDRFVLNIMSGKKLLRREVTRDQVSNLAVDSVSMILRHARAE